MSDQDISRRTYLKGATATGAASLAGFAGCTGFLGGGGGSLELLHGWSGGDGAAAFQSMLEGFKEEYSNAEVNANANPGGGNTSLNTVISNRLQADDPPGSWADWPGKNLLQFTDNDLLADIEGDVWDDDMKSAYLEGPKNVAKPDGTYVSVPTNIHRMNNLFYNKQVVESAGIDPASIESPGDLVSAMETVESETDAIGMAQSTQGPWTTVQLWAQVFLAQQGADGYDEFAAGNASQDAIAQAFETLAEYGEYFSSDASSIGWKEAGQYIVDGEAAFMHQGDWAAGFFSGQDGFNFGEQWGHVPFPGTEGLYSMNMDSWVAPADNPNAGVMKDWLSYCGTKDAQIRFNTKKGSIPPRSDVSMDEFPEFQTSQFEDFTNSDAQPPSVAHGLATRPETLTALKNAVNQQFSSYSSDSASKVAGKWVDAF